MQAVEQLRNQGFSELACQFAAYIKRQQTSENPLVTLTAGLLTQAVSEGHVCLNLNQTQTIPSSLVTFIPDDWTKQIAKSEVAGTPGEFKPLILNADGLLYLYRHWRDEQQVAQGIMQRARMLEKLPDEADLAEFLQGWHSDVEEPDWQKVAVLSALTQQLTVISGGPGTGKTTVVMRILEGLNTLQPEHRVALAAPTGKAAARLQSPINQAGLGLEAKTMHRLLKISPHQENGVYSASRPLPVDALIVDEASMIDISLMALLLNALPPDARLILLGDKDQLASVEAGAVLASLAVAEPVFSYTQAQLANQLLGYHLPEASTASLLDDNRVTLKHSFRFAQNSPVGRLADAVNRGDEMMALSVLAEQTLLFPAENQQIELQLINGFLPYIEAVENQADAESCLDLFEQFRMLTALRAGPQSVAQINQLMATLLSKRGWPTQQMFYAGRPLLITRNHYRLGLFNGDTGIVYPDADGELKACFRSAEGLRWLPLSRLPAHETVFAMTVHKSQGSEFNQVCLVLPETDMAVLSRELVYTAITRAREQVILLASEPVLKQAISRRHIRESGLAQAL